MDNKDAITRHEHLAAKLAIHCVVVDAGALSKIIYQADQQSGTRGWGKLIGYYKPSDHQLHINDSFALPMPKNDERIKKDSVEDLLGYKYRHTTYTYRYVGFYIICNDHNIFTQNIMNYFLNAEDIRSPKVLLVFSTEEALYGRHPWKMYDINEEINKRTTSIIYKDAYVYELEYAKLNEISVQNGHIFKELDFTVSKSPIFEFFIHKHRNTKRVKEEVKDGNSFGYLTTNVEDNVSQIVENLNNLLIDKKKGKTSAKINYLGAWIRHRELVDAKEKCLLSLKNKIASF